MKKIYVLLLLLAVLARASAQQENYPWVWLGGFDETNRAQNQIVFESVPVEFPFEVFVSFIGQNFEATVANISFWPDMPGLYTNGCRLESWGGPLTNGLYLNPGEVTDLVCPFNGYIVPQGATILPLYDHKLLYHLIHMGARFDPVRKLRLSPLYYSFFTGYFNGGTVTDKNVPLLDGDLGSFHTVRHGNGRDWWILAPQHGNRAWHTILLAQTEFRVQPVQPIAGATSGCERHEATAVSLDGSLVANWGDCKVSVLRFDRCTGAFFDLREIPTPGHWVPGGGLVFSPSGRYLYATSQTALFRADLERTPPFFDTLRYSDSPVSPNPYTTPGNTYSYMQNTPDGRIFIASASRAKYYHVIGKPDGGAKAEIDFKVRGLPLGVPNIRSVPHHPNYRLGSLKGSPCDTLNLVSDNEAPNARFFPVSLSPNPASDRVWVTDASRQSGLSGRFSLFTPTGILCYSAQTPLGEAYPLELPVGLPTGVYFWSLRREDGACAAGRLAVVR